MNNLYSAFESMLKCKWFWFATDLLKRRALLLGNIGVADRLTTSLEQNPPSILNPTAHQGVLRGKMTKVFYLIMERPWIPHKTFPGIVFSKNFPQKYVNVFCLWVFGYCLMFSQPVQLVEKRWEVWLIDGMTFIVFSRRLSPGHWHPQGLAHSPLFLQFNVLFRMQRGQWSGAKWSHNFDASKRHMA